MVQPPNGGFKMPRIKKRSHSRQKARGITSKILPIPHFRRLSILFVFVIIGVLTGGLPLFEPKVEADLTGESLGETEFIIFQDNSLAPISNPSNPEPQTVRKIRMVVTAYSSSSWETDDNPFLTAAGTWVREGIVANNLFPFGTRIKIPEIYGDKVFVVEDRMSRKKGYYHIDIWFSSYWEAKNFGAKRTYIEVLES